MLQISGDLVVGRDIVVVTRVSTGGRVHGVSSKLADMFNVVVHRCQFQVIRCGPAPLPPGDKGPLPLHLRGGRGCFVLLLRDGVLDWFPYPEERGCLPTQKDRLQHLPGGDRRRHGTADQYPFSWSIGLSNSLPARNLLRFSQNRSTRRSLRFGEPPAVWGVMSTFSIFHRG